jgi:ABC-type sugar transport system ATPase subunit
VLLVISVAFDQVSKTYPGGIVGLQPVSFELAAGQRLALLGPSGSGKSTWLRLLAGLESPTRGDIRFNGQCVNRVPAHRRGVAWLAQRPALYPHLTVRGNLQAVRRTDGQSQTSAELGEAAELCRVGHLLDRRPAQLSGGEIQRVALAKLVLRRAGVWLFDEPLAQLDFPLQCEFRRELHLLFQRTSATIIWVTHDPVDARALGGLVAILVAGRLHQFAPIEKVRSQPDHTFAAFGLSRWNLIPGRLVPRESGRDPGPPDFVSDCGSIRCPGPRLLKEQTGVRWTLGFPAPFLGGPEKPDPASPPILGWELSQAEPIGAGWEVTLVRDRLAIRAWWTSREAPRIGMPVPWSLPSEGRNWFDGETGTRWPDSNRELGTLAPPA